ncbi:MAG: hypothetical protein AAFX80_04785 [Cyanobacteria bacterium J06639_18]
MKQVITAFVGALFGFALPFGVRIWDRITKKRRYKAAIENEIRRAKQHIESKLNWVGRDVTEHIQKVDPNRVVDINGKQLYLGEDEEFELNFRFWNEKYTEIILVLSTREFSVFATIYQLLEDFVLKFKQMKKTFASEADHTTWDGRKAMALICYQDLLHIFNQIENLVKNM